MRLLDLVLRQGHVSEHALVDVLLTGERPAHLDRCELCAERADAIGQWLDEVAQAGVQATDAVFPAEILATQRAQILRRLEQLDEPARVIEFPSGMQPDLGSGLRNRGVAPRWVGIAAAAGLVLGVVGGQAMARLGGGNDAPVMATQPAQTMPAGAPAFRLQPETLMEIDLFSAPESLDAVDEMTPQLVAAARVGG